MKKIGLYIHVPFCDGKCPYCDFYSVRNSAELIDKYVENLNRTILSYKSCRLMADTVYFGGGTPSLLGSERIISILNAAKKAFGDISEETTLEVNPESAERLDFEKLKFSGINRISVGLQSADERELKLLGRRHTAEDVEKTVELAKRGGIDNISVDLMIGISGQTTESLSDSIDFAANLNITHISSYLLKIEEGTSYYKNKDNLSLPDDELVCDFYEQTVKRLNGLGFKQYEISNFAKRGKESRHNLKYWNCEEYLGIGSSAHSFIDKKRFYYERSLSKFYKGITVDDGAGGDEEEYIAMQLRLCTGLQYGKFKEYFGHELPQKYIDNARKLLPTGLLTVDEVGVRLNVKGFLCSNAVIVNIII